MGGRAQQKQTSERIFRVGINPETGEFDHDRFVALLMEAEATLSFVGGAFSAVALRDWVPGSPGEQRTVGVEMRWRSFSPAPPQPPAEPQPAEPPAPAAEAEIAPDDIAGAGELLAELEHAAGGAGGDS